MQQAIYDELEQVRQANGGFLRPADVLEYAKDETTALHGHFTWDDTEAARKYRLAEARALIRVAVIVHEQTSERVRAFVSLSSDRTPERGYRALADVLDDEVMAATLLKDALSEVAAFKRKLERYRELAELNGLIEAVEDVVTRHAPTAPPESRVSA